MKTACKIAFGSSFVLLGIVILSSFHAGPEPGPAFQFPYQRAGLTERQAAVHLLNRFTFGPRATDPEAVLDMGLETWFEKQLKADLPDDSLNARLSEYDALTLSNSEVVNRYPRANRVLRTAIAEGKLDQQARDPSQKAVYKEQLAAYMKEKGFRPQKELYRQFFDQKILRAAYSENQLQELLTDFWFNHFNVSLSKNQCAQFIPAYERDVIRPNVLGKFEVLLLATAQSPAMLTYLDNFTSSAAKDNDPQNHRKAQLRKEQGDTLKIKKPKTRGLNENYAREVMELHTLGVDGGYTQEDVTQVARILTGWTISPMNHKKGYGDFLFMPKGHDAGKKTVLGRHFPAGGGYGEGVALLKMLANHPSTARFICRKLAVRFVNDEPAQHLVDKMAATFEKTNGDIGKVLITMACSDEFWSKKALMQKTKSPFELAISAVRSVQAEIDKPYQLYNWVARMGQKLYYYQAPTGFPDKAQYWINTGALLSRMNFGLALAAGRIPGVHVDLAKFNQKHEPGSAEAASVGVMLGSPEFQRK